MFLSAIWWQWLNPHTSHPSTSASAKPACKLMLCQQRRHLGAKSNKIYYSCYYKNISFLHFVYILFSRHRYSPERFCKAGRSTSRNFRFWYFRDVSTHINLSNGDALTSATFSALAKPSGLYRFATPPGLPWHLLRCLCLLRLPCLNQTLPKTCNPQQSGWYHANIPILIQNFPSSPESLSQLGGSRVCRLSRVKQSPQVILAHSIYLYQSLQILMTMINDKPHLMLFAHTVYLSWWWIWQWRQY